MNSLSVVVCTYNPIEQIFSKCLDLVSKACEFARPLEILIIDNNSTNKFSERDYFIKFKDNHQPRCFIELKQGLTPARLKAIQEAKGDILLFVDDDNWLSENFFMEGLYIADQNPHIGAWSGSVKLNFEKEPESWAIPYLGLLVRRDIERDYWSNLPHLAETMPCGAGLYVRKEIAQHYLQLHKNGKRIIQLDRTGKSLFSGGDNDLAACACDLGMGVGVFHQLVLTHFIPAFRVEMDYLLKLAKGISASTVVLQAMRGKMPGTLSLKNKLADQIRLLLKSSIDRKFYTAVLSGQREGAQLVRTLEEKPA